jgi:hypothetical protein
MARGAAGATKTPLKSLETDDEDEDKDGGKRCPMTNVIRIFTFRS